MNTGEEDIRIAYFLYISLKSQTSSGVLQSIHSLINAY